MALIEDTEENRNKMVAVAERLRGSAGSVDEALQAEFGNEDLTLTDFSRELLLDLDEQVLECEQCGFWGDSGPFDDGICEDCQDENEDDD